MAMHFVRAVAIRYRGKEQPINKLAINIGQAIAWCLLPSLPSGSTPSAADEVLLAPLQQCHTVYTYHIDNIYLP